jgi:hypothetical protein
MEQDSKPKSSKPGRMLLQIPISESERRTLKHRAIDQGVTLGEVVRKALGLPMLVSADSSHELEKMA